MSRNTTAKSWVIETLQANNEALSHAELFDLLKTHCDRVTIYRILSRLVDEGVVHKVPLQDGTVKYALCHECSSAGHHHSHAHFSCIACGTVTCLEAVIPEVKAPKKFKAEEISYVISGRCASCH